MVAPEPVQLEPVEPLESTPVEPVEEAPAAPAVEIQREQTANTTTEIRREVKNQNLLNQSLRLQLKQIQVLSSLQNLQQRQLLLKQFIFCKQV